MHVITIRQAVQSMIVIVLLMGACLTAWALTLDEAKKQGLVGEKPNGYLGAVSDNPSPAVQALIADINRKRKQRYEEIAKRNNTTLQAVELLAGKTAIKKTEPGYYIQLPTGQWTKK